MVVRLAAVFGSFLAAVTVGCGADSSTESQATPSPTATSPAATQTTPGASTTGRSDTAPVAAAQAALRTAAAAVPNGRPFDLEIDSRGTEQVFDVKVASDANEFKILVDSSGNRVVTQQQKSTPDDDIAKLQGIQTDAVRALTTAGEQAGDAAFDEMEIDTNAANTVVWKVQFVRADGSEVEYEVDAQTGTVIATR